MKLFSIDNVINSIDSLETVSSGNGFLQSINTRCKLFSTLVFIITIISFKKYEVIGLVPFFFILSFLTAASNVSFKETFMRVLIASPFVLFIAILNPFFDHSKILIMGYTFNGGLISMISIILKFILTIWGVYLFIASTGFANLMNALRKLKVPEIITNQFFFFMRYLRKFLLDAQSIYRSRILRLGDNAKFDLKIFATLAQTLFTRSFKDAQAIGNAMDARGFSGTIPRGYIEDKIRLKDVLFLATALLCCIFFRIYPIWH